MKNTQSTSPPATEGPEPAETDYDDPEQDQEQEQEQEDEYEELPDETGNMAEQ